MVQLKPKMNAYREEILCMATEYDKKRIHIIFEEMCDFINKYYVSKESMNC